MATVTKPPKQLPSPQAQWFDPQTGKPTPIYYEYQKSMDALIRALRLEIP